MATDFRDILAQGLPGMGLGLDTAQWDGLAAYLQLLEKWNRIYNLTAVRDPVQMVARHILDSLAVAPFIHGDRLLDVGTGAGLPGMVLAIALPDLACVLLDSNGKKTRFCLQAALELGLSNVEVVQERAEGYRTTRRFSTIVFRALGSIKDTLGAVAGLSASGGRILAMKGIYPGPELREVAYLRECVKVEPLSVPGLDAERHLVIVDMGCVAEKEIPLLRR